MHFGTDVIREEAGGERGTERETERETKRETERETESGGRTDDPEEAHECGGTTCLKSWRGKREREKEKEKERERESGRKRM